MSVEMLMTTPAIDPLVLLRTQRERLFTLAAPGSGDAGPLSDLPDDIRGLVHDYEADHPRVRVEIYWYVDLNGTDAVTQGDLAAVDIDDLDAVVLSHTRTTMTSDAVAVRSLVAL